MLQKHLKFIINELERNASVFMHLLGDTEPEIYLWKPQPEQWCMLEVACHLLDEEREDFRARAKHILEKPDQPMPSINPTAWVQERNYLAQPFHEVVAQFVDERNQSVQWLRSLDSTVLTRPFTHPILGKVSPGYFISAWFAHDLLHIRQLNRLRYLCLSRHSPFPIDYAGPWVSENNLTGSL